MEFPNQQQLFDILGKSEKILVAVPKNPNADALGSALAFAVFLRKLNKEVNVYCPTVNFGNLAFLPDVDSVQERSNFPRQFIISVNTSRVAVDEISYDQHGDRLDINLVPKSGNFSKEDITVRNSGGNLGLVVCLDVPLLENLGELYTNNAEMFFNSTKVNIDNHINNENYANINVVDITAASTAEIVYELLKNYEESIIDENIATNLLAGIIAETNSFQNSSTTPNSFMRAAELIRRGARQQEIIQHLFKTKELAMLKLWGRAMARIRTLQEFSAVYSLVTIQDIERSETGPAELLKVMQEFVRNISEVPLIFFIAEGSGRLEMFIYSNPNIKLSEVVNYFGGEYVAVSIGHAFLEGVSINNVEDTLVKALRELRPRLGLG